MSNLDENRLPRGHNPKTLAALSGLIKRANKKLKRLLIPPNTPHQFFDTDHFKEKEANVKKALEDDITDFAQLEVATLNAERTIDLESEEYEALQDQIQKDEANRRKIQQELQTRHAFVDQQPQNDSYAWNLLRFPSSSFSKGQ
ncbi:hypothetical protein BX666DRAFT_226981 [Dichotomocladium elegans]|nr:hypothetical protein BX666DRAFT_226981 [Dichotomocladium elegans]